MRAISHRWLFKFKCKICPSVTLATFQVYSFYMWLVATKLASTDTERFSHCRKFYWIALVWRIHTEGFIRRKFNGLWSNSSLTLVCIDQCFFRVWSWASSIIQELVRNANPQAPAQTNWLRDSEVGLALCTLTSPPGDSNAPHTLIWINNDATCDEHFIRIISLKCSSSTNTVR